MQAKQVNIAVPIKLFEKMEKYIENYGYMNAQDFFLDLARQKVIFEEKDNLSYNDEFVEEMLNVKKNDFLGENESKKLHKKLMKKARL